LVSCLKFHVSYFLFRVVVVRNNMKQETGNKKPKSVTYHCKIMKNIALGLIFSILWASASVAAKIGLKSGEPFILFAVRFFLAAFIMLAWAHLLRGYALPKRADFKPLFIYGVLNVTLYLGLFVLSMQQAAAGIGTLGVGINPLIISVLSAIWLQKSISKNVWLGLGLGLLGVAIATYPLLQNAYATPMGIGLLVASMVSYSVGTIYYSSREWHLPNLVINAWQVLFGGIALLPFMFTMSDFSKNQWDARFWWSVLWLVVPVSIISVQLWLYLLRIDTVRAAMWLFLCPIFGFIYAAVLLNEPITSYTFIGTGLVIVGLYLGRKKG
jgi:probable blue pigment (indigoidine) exporter